MSLPLTPSDELSLRVWLYKRLAEGKNPLEVLQEALETPVDELIPWQENTPSSSDSGIELHSVQDVLRAVCGPISENDREQFQKLADQLAQHLMPPKDLVFLTHYFVTRWLPKLGHGQGWLVVLMRDRCYINQRTGEIRDETLVDQGYAEIASWLGLKRLKPFGSGCVTMKLPGLFERLVTRSVTGRIVMSLQSLFRRTYDRR